MGDGGSGAGYFLLVRHRGSEEFIAMPVSEWQNFKPMVQRATNRWGVGRWQGASQGGGYQCLGVPQLLWGPLSYEHACDAKPLCKCAGQGVRAGGWCLINNAWNLPGTRGGAPTGT